MLKTKEEYFASLCHKIGTPTTDSPAADFQRPLFDVVYEMIADALGTPPHAEPKAGG